MEEEVQLRSVFMASWAILTHCLYCKRVQSLDSAAPATSGYLAAAQGRAADAVIAAWKRELRCLLWAYARVDLDKPCETNGIASWRATFHRATGTTIRLTRPTRTTRSSPLPFRRWKGTPS